MVAANTVSTHRQGLGLDSLKFRSRPIAKKGSLLGIRFEMCAYAGGLYAETFALIVDVTIVLFSVFLCNSFEGLSGLARESSQTWHLGMILHELKNSSSFPLYLKITVSGESNP
uniref:Uncharacterized protein n=1 Tax=Salix viminalis TaxID=40686 RepID=A0A6N2KMJ3_SALVM